MKLGRSKQKPMAPLAVVRHRRAGTPIEDHSIQDTSVENRTYVDLEHNDNGDITTDPTTIPRTMS